MKRDLVIIGGGPAGLSAAISAYDEGIRDILLIERDEEFGGILNQCIHNGFGLHTFKEELTGPEYADRYKKIFLEKNIEYKLNTLVLEIDENKNITYINEEGIKKIEAKAIILAMGCRERSRGALTVPGDRGAGVFSAGTAQKLINIDGILPGSEAVILGSGDIGLIMARRMSLEGIKVKAVLEIMPYSNGLNRNIVQCLEDFQIPLKLSHTITKIIGKKRVEAVEVSKVDENLRAIKGTEEIIKCDTVLFSVGLIPENEIVKKTGITINEKTKGIVVDSSLMGDVDGIFSCGNVLHVHDLVDFVSEEAELCGKSAADYIKDKKTSKDKIKVNKNEKISYVIPNFINRDEKNICFRFRVTNVFRDKKISIYFDNKKVYSVNKKILLPAEMISIDLKVKENLENIKDIEIKVED